MPSPTSDLPSPTRPHPIESSALQHLRLRGRRQVHAHRPAALRLEVADGGSDRGAGTQSADITGGGQINLANLTDGLRAEREQGITIDVAYRYFATPAPQVHRRRHAGPRAVHAQHGHRAPRTANLSIVLVDARQGVIEQTRRHTFIAAMLGIPHLVIAVNKMDLVDWNEERFLEIRDEIEDFLPRLDVFKDVKFIPISALNGDNVVGPPSTRRGIRAPTCWAISKPSTSPATGT